MNDIYLFLSSDDSLNLYPQNNAYSFTVQLPEIIQMTNEWTCCLVYFLCNMKDDVSSVYILCDAINDSFVKNTKLPVLQYVHAKTSNELMFEICNGSEIEIRVNKTSLHTISIHIRDANSFKPIVASDDSGYSRCVIRLRKA